MIVSKITEEPPIRDLHLIPAKLYRATLIWVSKGYRSSVPLQPYYVRIGRTHGHFYKDKELKRCRGCFPLHWFDNFELVGDIPTTDDNKTSETIVNNNDSEPAEEQLELLDFDM